MKNFTTISKKGYTKLLDFALNFKASEPPILLDIYVDD